MERIVKLAAIVVGGLLVGAGVGCAGLAMVRPTHAVVGPTAMIPPALAASPSPTTSAPTFTPATYTDDYAGFAVDYPAEWTLDQSSAGARSQRGYFVQLTSWVHAPGDLSAQTPAGGSRMDITVSRWDPKKDLDAYIARRKTSWESSGLTVTAEETWTLAGDLRAVRFLVRASDETAFFLVTTAGDLYLVLSGTGDLGMLEAISRTTRMLSAP